MNTLYISKNKYTGVCKYIVSNNTHSNNVCVCVCVCICVCVCAVIHK